MRRTAPRPLQRAIVRVTGEIAPASLLARVQAVWDDAAGPALAAQAAPVSEHHGTVEIRCSAGPWAQEIELLGPDLIEALNTRLEPSGAGPVRGIRARSGRKR